MRKFITSNLKQINQFQSVYNLYLISLLFYSPVCDGLKRNKYTLTILGARLSYHLK